MEFFIVTNPIFIPAPFARDSAYKNTIQKTRQSGQDQEDFTWTDGAPLITMTPKDNGGLAPKGQDFNGVLNAVSENTVFVQNGNRYKWSSDVVSNYGGYESGAIIQSDDNTKEFISLINNNTSNPNVSLGSNWSIYAGQGSVPTASSTIAGVTKVLNNLNSTDTGSALSAAQGKTLNDKFNFQNSKNPSGYVRFGDSGLIMQWGTVDYNSNPGEIAVDVYFPISFSVACLNVTATRKSLADYYGDGVIAIVSQNNSFVKFQLNTWGDGVSGLRGFTWFAIGY